MTSVWFVTPAWKRFELSRVAFAQRRAAMDALGAMGLDAHCVVVADDENLEIARDFGFEVVRQNNSGLGRKFNDGMEYAGRHGADFIVPIGSDSWIDPAFFADLPTDGSVLTSHLYAVVEMNRIAELTITTVAGVGPYVFPRALLEPCRFRPAADRLMRGIDGSTVAGIEAASGTIRWQARDLHPLQYVGFRGNPQINRYERLRDRWGVRESSDPWPLLEGHYEPAVVAEARRVYSAGADAERKRVLIYSTTRDTNGNGFRIRQGFEREAPGYRVDLVALHGDGHPEQHGGTPLERRRSAAGLAARMDILHLFNGLQGWGDFGRDRGTPTLVHHHGTSFRSEHDRIAAGCRVIGAVQVASTIDLVVLEPDVEWLPAIYDLDELAAIRAEHYMASDLIRIAHAPTHRRIKGTDAVQAAVESFGDRVEFDLIEHAPWDECLRRVARADIVIDQLRLGYGSLAVEAWGMGIPVVAGLAPEQEATRAEMLRRWGSLPFVDASPEMLPKVLERLVRSARARKDAAAIGAAHAARYHAEPVVVAQLRDIYAGLQPTRRPKSTWRGVRPWKKAAAA